MAKIFYDMAETMQKLGLTEPAVMELVAAGQLRVYNEGPNKRFKVSHVDRRAAGEPEPTLDDLVRAATVS